MTPKEIKRIEIVYKKMILNFLGVEVEEVKNMKVSEIDPLLISFEKNNYEEFMKAYNVVVNKKFSDAPEKKIIDFTTAVRLVRDEVEALENSAIKSVGERFSQTAAEFISESKASIEAFEKKREEEKIAFVEEARKEIQDAIERESKKFNRIEIKVGNSKPKQVNGVLPEEFPHLLSLASSRVNILMVGPTGCGKTFVSSKIAEALDLDFSSQSCSAGVSESVFTGWLIPVGGGGKFVYVQSEFVRIYENGGVFLFDEIDASDANVLVFLNQAIANEGFIVPQRHEKPYVKKHKDFVCVAAANTNGAGADSMYHGRNSLDEATLDRFRVGTVIMNYSEKVEREIIDPEVLKFGIKIRNFISEKKLMRVMSTRTLIDATTMKRDHGMKTSHTFQGYFNSWSPEELKMLAQSVLLEAEEL